MKSSDTATAANGKCEADERLHEDASSPHVLFSFPTVVVAVVVVVVFVFAAVVLGVAMARRSAVQSVAQRGRRVARR